MKKLSIHTLESIDHLVQPEEFDPPDIKSPAKLVCTDFHLTHPLVIDATLPIDVAERLMRAAHVKFKLVVNEELELVGAVSYRDLIGEEVIKRIAQGQPRDQLLVADIMKPRSELVGLDANELEDATIEDVIETLKEHGEQHCLVVDHQKHQITGLISASDIARRLHIPLEIEKTPNFIDIFNAIKGLKDINVAAR